MVRGNLPSELLNRIYGELDPVSQARLRTASTAVRNNMARAGIAEIPYPAPNQVPSASFPVRRPTPKQVESMTVVLRAVKSITTEARKWHGYWGGAMDLYHDAYTFLRALKPPGVTYMSVKGKNDFGGAASNFDDDVSFSMSNYNSNNNDAFNNAGWGNLIVTLRGGNVEAELFFLVKWNPARMWSLQFPELVLKSRFTRDAVSYTVIHMGRRMRNYVDDRLFEDLLYDMQRARRESIEPVPGQWMHDVGIRVQYHLMMRRALQALGVEHHMTNANVGGAAHYVGAVVRRHPI